MIKKGKWTKNPPLFNIECILKLNVIVIFFRGEIKLADFGLARLYEADERYGHFYLPCLNVNLHCEHQSCNI